MVSFNRKGDGSFQKNSSIYSVFHGTHSFILEDELNELQWTQIENIAAQTREQYTNGFLKSVDIITNEYDNFFAIKNKDENPMSLFVDGYLLKVGANKPADLPVDLVPSDDKIIFKLNKAGTTDRKDLLLMEVWFEIIGYTEQLMKYGGVDTETIPNKILDTRSNIETSKRIQLRWRIRSVDNQDDITKVYASNYNGNPSSAKYEPHDGIFIANTGVKEFQGSLKSNGIVYGIPLFTVTRPANDDKIVTENIESVLPQSKSLLSPDLSNLVKSVNDHSWISTDGQTSFTLPENQEYEPNTKSIEVFVNGIKQISGLNFEETSKTSFTMFESIPAGIIIEAKWYQGALPVALGHNSLHRAGGADELPIDSLKGYKELLDIIHSNVVTVLKSLPAATSSMRHRQIIIEGEEARFEIASLKVNSGCTTNGNATITLNGVAYNVALSASDNTAAMVAAKIRTFVYPGWTTGGTDTVVIFNCNDAGPRVDSKYSANNTGANSVMTTTQKGVTSTSDKIYICKKLAGDTYEWVQIG